jgi:FkbM family methyltransferase
VRLRRRRATNDERSAAFAAASKLSGHVSVEVDGALYLVSTADTGVGEDVYVARRRPEFIVLARAMETIGAPRADATFVDVGANIGTTTIPALLRFGFRDAVAIEPGEGSVRLLQAACALNGLASRVRVLQAAASDPDGSVRLNTGTSSAGTFEVGDVPGAVEVQSVTVDSVVEPERVGLLWVDAQGHEGQVLAGAARVLAERPPAVLALRPGKLERAGGLEQYVATLTETYAQVADLREPGLRKEWRPQLEPTAALQRYVDEGRKTDLLFLPG